MYTFCHLHIVIVTTILIMIWNISLIPKGFPVLLYSHSPLPTLGPQHPLVTLCNCYFAFPRFSLKRITLYVVFCACLLALILRLLRFMLFLVLVVCFIWLLCSIPLQGYTFFNPFTILMLHLDFFSFGLRTIA